MRALFSYISCFCYVLATPLGYRTFDDAGAFSSGVRWYRDGIGRLVLVRSGTDDL